jgi:hypothetical protein
MGIRLHNTKWNNLSKAATIAKRYTIKHNFGITLILENLQLHEKIQHIFVNLMIECDLEKCNILKQNATLFLNFEMVAQL